MIAIGKASQDRHFDAYPSFGGRVVRPARGRSLLIALALTLASAGVSLTLLPAGGTAQAAPASLSVTPAVAHEVRTTQKADRLVRPTKLQGGCDGAWGNEPLDCLLRTA